MVRRLENPQPLRIANSRKVAKSAGTSPGRRVALPDVKASRYRLQSTPTTKYPSRARTSAPFSPDRRAAGRLETKSGGEMGFNLGIFSVEDLQEKRTVMARRVNGTIEAFVTWRRTGPAAPSSLTP